MNLNNNNALDNSQHLQPIAVRITSRHDFVQNNKQRGRNQNNIIDIAKKNQLNNREKLRFANWNAKSVNKKSASICDFVIAKRLDLLALRLQFSLKPKEVAKWRFLSIWIDQK